MFQIKARILSNAQVAFDYSHMSLEAPSIAEAAEPGQFIQIRCNDTLSPLLRRPFSIHKVSSQLSTLNSQQDAKVVEILYKVVGKGTELLSKKKKEEKLDIIGPLGNGFSAPNSQVQTVILIGGGIGVAPLLFLAERLTQIKNSPPHMYVIIGAKTKESVLCEEEFKTLRLNPNLHPGGASKVEVRIATEDGSLGFKGTATALLCDLLSTINYQLSTIYASGPKPMLKEIARICQKEGIPCYLSLEEIIACGFGACLGCTVNTKEGYKLVCKDGPVFNRTQLLWNETDTHLHPRGVNKVNLELW